MTATTELRTAIRVRLLLFAVLREIVGSESKEIELPAGATSAEPWETLRSEHRALAAYTTPPMTAVNMNYVDPSTPLRDGDEVAFIPPVAGG